MDIEENKDQQQETPTPETPPGEGKQETNLFGDEETPTEAELMGEVPPGGDKPPEKPPEPPSSPGTAGPPADTKPPETPAEKTDTKPPEKPAEKPPEGYVPLAALQEERGKRQQLALALDDLKKVVEDRKNKPAEPPETPGEDEFKILTKDEYAKLAEDDIVAAQVYLYELAEYNNKQAAKEKGQAKTDDLTTKINEQVTLRHKEIEEAIPGIYDESSPVNKDMTTFAVENGMDVDYLAALTDPGSRITLSDGSTFILGRGAVGLAKMIHSTMTKSKNGAVDVNALRETIKKEVTQEMLEKFRTSGADAFRSTGDSPGVGEKPADTGQVTEDTFRNLPEDQQERLLRGT
jgi:hypothetical protein